MTWMKAKQKSLAKQEFSEKSISLLVSHHHSKTGPVLVIHGGGFSYAVTFRSLLFTN